MHRIHYHFEVVLGLIIAAIAFALAAPEGDWARFIAVCLQAAVLVAACFASRVHPGVIVFACVGAVVGVVGAGAAVFGSGQFGNSSAAVVALFYVLLTPPALVTGVIKQFRQTERVTLQTMFGVLCLYLLLGLLFSVSFVAVQELTGQAFFQSGNGERDDFLYFSYATLTTVGYGDLVAATNLGRSLGITEALMGQIYLVTVVAVIISNLDPAAARAQRRKAKQS